MSITKNKQYIYYIDSKSVLTILDYEKLMQKSTNIRDLIKIAIKLNLPGGEPEKERIRSSIFDKLKSKGIAEPIRIKRGSYPSTVNVPSPNTVNVNVNVPSPNTVNVNVPSPNTVNVNVPSPNNTRIKVTNSNNNTPGFEPKFVNNKIYNGYTSTSDMPSKPKFTKSVNRSHSLNTRKNTGNVQKILSELENLKYHL